MAEKKQSEHSDWAWSESGDVEVPINDWERFLDSFSSQHQGWLASLATVSGRHALESAASLAKNWFVRYLSMNQEKSEVA